jgi:hypothetical protein
MIALFERLFSFEIAVYLYCESDANLYESGTSDLYC